MIDRVKLIITCRFLLKRNLVGRDVCYSHVENVKDNVLLLLYMGYACYKDLLLTHIAYSSTTYVQLINQPAHNKEKSWEKRRKM